MACPAETTRTLVQQKQKQFKIQPIMASTSRRRSLEMKTGTELELKIAAGAVAEQATNLAM
jgi:hypothetical protein